MTASEIIQRHTGQPVTEETSIEAFDSLELVDAVLSIEEATGKSIDNRRLVGMQTLGDITSTFLG